MSGKKKSVKKVVEKASVKNNSFWLWIAIAFLALVILFFAYKGITGNVTFGGGDIMSSLQGGIDQIKPVLEFFLGSEYAYNGQMLFERFLFFILILSIVFVVLKRVELFRGQKNIMVILALVVSILSVRYINFEWLNTMMLSYSVLGVALTSFLPFLIYFFFLQGMAPNSSFARKIGWCLFIAVYVGLYITASEKFYGQVYMWTGLAAVVFLFLDGTINRYLLWEKIKGSGRESIDAAVISIRREMWSLKQDLDHHIITSAHYEKQMLRLQENMKSIMKHSF